MSSTKNNQQGFTIVELMIATTVLATLLVIVTAAITGIGSLYFKGVTQSSLQSSVRTVSDDIATSIRLSQTDIKQYPADGNPTDLGAICIGTTRYSYAPHQKIEGAYKHVLWRDEIASGADCTPANLKSALAADAGDEFIPDNTRLVKMIVKQEPGLPASVDIAFITGPDELICSPTVNNSCTSSGAMSSAGYDHDDLQCKPSTQSKFCAFASSSLVAMRRL